MFFGPTLNVHALVSVQQWPGTHTHIHTHTHTYTYTHSVGHISLSQPHTRTYTHTHMLTCTFTCIHAQVSIQRWPGRRPHPVHRVFGIQGQARPQVPCCACGEWSQTHTQTNYTHTHTYTHAHTQTHTHTRTHTWNRARI